MSEKNEMLRECPFCEIKMLQLGNNAFGHPLTYDCILTGYCFVEHEKRLWNTRPREKMPLDKNDLP